MALRHKKTMGTDAGWPINSAMDGEAFAKAIVITDDNGMGMLELFAVLGGLTDINAWGDEVVTAHADIFEYAV